MLKVIMLIFFCIASCWASLVPLSDMKISENPLDSNSKSAISMIPYTGGVPHFPSAGVYVISASVDFEKCGSLNDPYLFIPPLPFPVEVRLNGEEVYRWGNLNSESSKSNFSSVAQPLSHHNEKINNFEIYIYSDGQKVSVSPFYVGESKLVLKRAFVQTLLNHGLVQAIAVMAFFASLTFFGHAASSGFREKDILSFALLALMIFLGYTPFIFNYPLSNDVLWFKISRLSYVLVVYYIYLFCSSFTGLFTSKLWKIVFGIIMVPLLFAILKSGSKMEINAWFGIISLIYILPLILFNLLLLIFASFKKKQIDVGIITFGYVVFTCGVFVDIYYIIGMREPFTWITPYSYFVLICAMIFAIYLRQNLLHRELLLYKTELVYTNQSLLNAHTKLVAESSAKEQFIRAIAHEFRTPLNGMVGILDTFIQDGKRIWPDYMQQNSVLLASSFHRFELIVQNLIDYQELKSGEVVLENHPFSPKELISRLVGYCHDDAKLKEISLISLVNESDLPALLLGDYTRIAVVVNNLLRNAVKFTTVGGVSIKAEYKDETLSVTISDTGSGIDPSIQQLIFQAFTRGEEIAFTQRYEGIGLGLAIVDALIKQMDGKLDLVSEKGKGTRFVLHLPLEIPADSSSDGAAIRVLVADDNLVNRTVMIHQLAQNGYVTASAENGEEAVNQVVNSRVDVVLMDIQMPVMDGLEATVLLRQKYPHLPIIGVTANADRESCIESGMDDVLFKPTSADVLHSVIQKFIHKR